METIATVKWIKIMTDIFDDEKILMIESMPSADSIIVVWFKLLTLAGKQNNDGVLMMSNRIAYTDEMLASIFRRDVNVVRMALKVFEQFGMVEIVENVITIPNWNKHQTLDSYEKRKERDRLYQQERRNKQKALALGKSTDASTDASTDVGFSEEEREEDKEGDIEIYSIGTSNEAPKPTRKKFIKPSLEEVQAYCCERSNNVDAEKFIDYYESNGWKVGKNPMKDWKAAVRTWEKSSYEKPAKQQEKHGVDRLLEMLREEEERNGEGSFY